MNLEFLKFNQDKPIAFVLPRCSKEIAGGAESLCLNLASKIARYGIKSEILSTCAKDNRSWENFYPKGIGEEKGITVRRFPVNKRDLETWIPLQLKLQDGFKLTVDEQLLWMQESVNSDELYSFIKEEKDNYSAFIFAPYMFGTTFFGSQIYPEKSYLLPCLHKEMYAELDVFKAIFKNIKGCIFNAEPEKELAESYFGKINGGVVGLGFEKSNFKKPENYNFDFDYVLYIGRKETGKNVHSLIDYFIFAKDNNLIDPSIKLVIAGPGDFSDTLRMEALKRDDVVDLPLVNEDEKANLIKNCLSLCQPSQNESFSIVLMEAWLQKSSVIVHGDCAVTKFHALKSNGGLYFNDEVEFSYVVKYLHENKEVNNTLGENGFNYVESEYSWNAVLERFIKVSSELKIIDEQPNIH